MVSTRASRANAAAELALIYGAEDETITPELMEQALAECLAELEERVLEDWQWWLVSGYSPVSRLLADAVRTEQRRTQRGGEAQ